MKKDSIRSPLFYVGDKYKLMPQLNKLFPANIKNYVEPFVGGGSSFLNTSAENFYLNDLDSWVIRIHEELQKYTDKKDVFFKKIYELVDQYELSCSFRGRFAPDELKVKYPKTYYAKYNKDAYMRLKADFNKNQNDILRLYVLLIYGFNHMIRFNQKGEFNLPVGDVDFNKNVYNALNRYFDICSRRAEIHFYSQDYKQFLDNLDTLDADSYVYCDPPYLISASEYNKNWNETNERELYQYLDKLNEGGIKFGLTNLVKHKGQTNEILVEWCKKYKVYNIQSNYISFNDNTIKTDSKEVFVTNYEENRGA